MSTGLTTRADTGFLVIDTFDQAIKVAEYVNKSALVPDAYRGKPADIVIAMQYGMELGLSPMQALQSVAVVNGRPSLWGDALPALIIGQPDCDGIDAPEPEGDDDKAWVATCTVHRRGRPPVKRSFSYKDAVTAGLWGTNTWKKYPKRMLMMRARAFAIRDAYPDRMKGILTTEEAIDITPERVEPPEPRRLSEPAAAPSSTASPVSPVGAAATATSQPPAVAAPASTPMHAERGVKVLSTSTIQDEKGNLFEIETTRGVFYTRDQSRYEEIATCEDTPTALVFTWFDAKRKVKDKLVAIKVVDMVALDEQSAPEQPALPTEGE